MTITPDPPSGPMAAAVRLERDGRIATLLLDRADKGNAMNLAMWQAIPELVDEAVADPGVSVLVVRGAGDGPFCAGADIAEFQTIRAGAENARAYNKEVERAAVALSTAAIPTIAMIRRFCVGGGCELALSCDIRVAEPGARLGITPAKLGIVYGFSSTRRLVETVGHAWARYLLFSADLVDAETAQRIGLVNTLHPADELEKGTYDLADHIAHRSPVSVRSAKTVIQSILDGHTEEDARLTALYDTSFTAGDYAEGVQAFLEKREPNFPGR